MVSYRVQNLKFLSFFSALKEPLHFKLYGQAVLPFCGFIYAFLNSRSLWQVKHLPLLLPLYALLHSCLVLNAGSIARSFQFLGAFLSCYFFKSYFSLSDFKKSQRIVLYICSLFTILEALFFEPFGMQNPILGIELPRYFGVVGEPNYSAAFYLGLLIISYKFKDKVSLFGYLLLIFSTASRTTLFCVLLLVLAELSANLLRKFHAIIIKAIVILILCYPLMLLLLYPGISPEDVKKLDQLTSNRVSIHYTHTKIFSENPLGVGYFQGHKYLETNKDNYTVPQISQSHSIFVQTYSELGALGSIFLSTLILGLSQVLGRRGRFHLNAFFVMLIQFSSLNGFNEFILFYLISFLFILPEE